MSLLAALLLASVLPVAPAASDGLQPVPKE